jgi:two-component system alkaline phosphatase synthesis response regulator PhoP
LSRWILVVEDESALGEMICDNLRGEGYGAELIRTGTAADERIAKGGVDLVILDIMLPGIDGFSILEKMRKRGDDTPVLIVSALISDADRIRGLSLRADDYLTKPFNLKELLLRVGALLRRGQSATSGPDILEFGGNRVDFRGLRATNFEGADSRLSPNEIKILRLLSGRPGEVVTRREIVGQLFGPTTSPATRSLDNMVLNLRRTLERDSKKPKHIHTVRGVGLRFTTEAES